jgi:uncharacterized protein (TIGR00369 family)
MEKKKRRTRGAPETDRIRFLVRQPDRVVGLAKSLGMRLLSIRRNRVRILLPWSRKIRQRDGLIHGGALATLADTAAGLGTLYLLPRGWNTLSTHLEIEFFGNIRFGSVEAEARLLHRGRKSKVWEVKIHETGKKELLAVSIVTLLMVPPSVLNSKSGKA